MKRAPFLFVLPLLFVVPSLAVAAEKEDDKTPPSDAHLRGVELSLRPTLGGVGGDGPVTVAGGDAPAALRAGASQYKWAAGVGMQLGWRFHPFVSAGLRFDYANVSAETPSDGTSDHSRQTMGGGLYARIYPLAMNEPARRRFDPWLGVGAGYARDVASFSMPEDRTRVDVQATRHAIAIPLGVGFDYRVTEWMSVGPSFEYVLMNPVAGCVKASVGARSEQICTDDSKGQLVASTAGAWNGGIMLRVTPF